MFAEGAVIGEYTLQRKLGQGPMAEVWRAKTAERPDPVALKLLRSGALAPSATRRAFERLVSALSEVGRLEHPHLPQPLGTVRRSNDGLFGLASPYFEGGALFDAGDLTDPAALHDALELIIQLGQTVMWLHEQGVVHGAIKPSNVLASPSAQGPAVRLLDLCWARAGLCRLEGTRFEPPEAKQGPPTAAADQWAVARLLRVLVARRAPEPVGAWSRVPLDLREPVDRSLAEDPAQRYPRVADLVDALVNAQGGLQPSLPTQPDPHQLPAPTVPVLPHRLDSLDIESSTTDPLAVENDPTQLDPMGPVGTDPDAPTEPALSELDSDEVRKLAGTVKMVDINTVRKPPTNPVEMAAIDPSAESSEPSDVVPPVPSPNDPTAPLDPESPRGASLAFIVAAAGAVAIAAYAWTVTLGSVDPTERPAPVASPAPSPKPSPSPAPGGSAPSPTPATRAATPPATDTRTDATKRPPRPTEPAPDAEQPSPRARSAAAEAKTAGATPADKRMSAKRPSPERTTAERPSPAKRISTQDKPVSVDVAAKDHVWSDCQSGIRKACLALATQHERAKQWLAAGRAREQACKLGHRGSCMPAARHFERAQEGRAARRAYERLCDAREAKACAELSRLFRMGIGGRANARTARAFLRRACELGHRPSCP